MPSYQAPGQRLVYVRREVDDKLVAMLEKHACIGILEPSRRGKTCLVESMQTVGYRYCVVVNGIRDRLTQLVADALPPPSNGSSWDDVMNRTEALARCIFDCCLDDINGTADLRTAVQGIGVESKPRFVTTSAKSIIHIDELQDAYKYPRKGVDFVALRNASDINRDTPGAAVALLLAHWCNFANSTEDRVVRIVASGVDIRGADAMNIAGASKYQKLSIPPITSGFAKEVLRQNGVVLDDDTDLSFLPDHGNVGQLASIIKTKTADGVLELGEAFVDWVSMLRRRDWVAPAVALGILAFLASADVQTHENCLIISGVDIAEVGYLDVTGFGHSGWLRVVSTSPVMIERPSRWHSDAFGMVLRRVSPVLVDAFHMLNATHVSGPKVLRGPVLQLLFAWELFQNPETPLFDALGVRPCAFEGFERTNKNRVWLRNTLYLVTHESSERTIGDLIFYDGSGKLVVVEVNSSRDCDCLKKDLTKLSRVAAEYIPPEDATEVIFRFVVVATENEFTAQDEHVVVVHDVTSLEGLTVDLAAVGRSSVADFVRHVAAIADPSLLNFQVQRTTSATGDTRIRQRESYWVKLHEESSSTKTDLAAVLKDRDLSHTVDGLKEALLYKLQLNYTVRQLTVYPQGESVGSSPFTDMAARVGPAESDSPYHIKIGKKRVEEVPRTFVSSRFADDDMICEK